MERAIRLDGLAAEFKKHFDSSDGKDPALFFKDFAIAHNETVSDDEAFGAVYGNLTFVEVALCKQLRELITNKSEVLYDEYGNECMAMPVTDVMRAALEDPEFILLAGHIRSLRNECVNGVDGAKGTMMYLSFPVPEKSASINLETGVKTLSWYVKKHDLKIGNGSSEQSETHS